MARRDSTCPSALRTRRSSTRRHAGVCNGTDLNITATNCSNTVTGRVTTERMSRTPDQRLYSSGSRDAFYWTQCYVSLGDPDGEDFMFTKCDANGNFTFTGVPAGSWRLSIFDQWNDQLMDGLSTPVNVAGNVTMGDIPIQQWQANVYTRTFIDDNKDGVYQSTELGIPFLNTTVRYRDGSLANNLTTDFTGLLTSTRPFRCSTGMWWKRIRPAIRRRESTPCTTPADQPTAPPAAAATRHAGARARPTLTWRIP